MSVPYSNGQPWSQQQTSFNQSHQPNFSFSTLAGTPSDTQSQHSYGYSSQLQLPSGNAASSPPEHNNLNGGQPLSRSSSFGDATPSQSVIAGFNSNTNQRQNMTTYNPIFPSDQMAWNDPNALQYGRSIPNSGYHTSSFTSEITGARLSSSPNGMQDSFPHSYSSHTTDLGVKRPHEDPREMDDLDEGTVDPKEAAKAKPGACSRCKTLKVRCEFRTDNDPCKRCLNGGHECVIPGRKKRRAPPKREHLLAQIRDQAAQIKALMTQLEQISVRSGRASSVASGSFASSPALQSPLLSPASTNTSNLQPEESRNSELDAEASKAIEDWIAKAKQSFKEFDVFIGVGGAGMPRNYLVDGGLESSELSSDDDEYVNISDNENSDYEFAIENHDGEESSGVRATLRNQNSSSSLNTNDTGRGTQHKKYNGDHSKPVILPAEAAPFGLFGNLALKSIGPKKRKSSSEVEEEKIPGIANPTFFKSTPAPEAIVKRMENIQNPPQVLTRRIISTTEAEELFKIYFERMNLSVSLLDPVLYTAQKTCYRSPFLFTVICAIASRFYAQRPGLYNQVMSCAQQAAGLALISGHKNIEMCQAYILLSLYPVPARRWEDQRSWLYLGLAIRTATDLNLHLPNTANPVNENHAREMLNRTRVWLNCFNLDRSTGSQYGRPPIISSGDYMANHSENWWMSSEHNMKNFDIHICAYNAELKVIASFMTKIYSDPHHPTGLNKEVDFEKIASEADEELKHLEKRWMTILDTTDMSDPQNSFRTGLLRLAYPYARLVMLSYGFQHAFGKNTDENPFLARCLTAAFDVVLPVLNDLCRPSQRIFFRHGPEAQSVFVTFASAFLVKLLQPKFASYLTIEKRLEIRQVVQSVVDLLSCAEIAIDDRHGPGLYAKFLKGLLATPMAQVDATSPPSSSRRARMPLTITHSTESSNEYNNVTSRKSQSSRTSVSPTPRLEALSFESFSPAGATDPFAPTSSNSLALHMVGESGTSNLMADFFSPPLPFDNAIYNSMQALSDTVSWQDIPIPPNYAWDSFNQNLDTDYRGQSSNMFSSPELYRPGAPTIK